MLHTATDTIRKTRWRDRPRPYVGTGSRAVGRWAHAYREGQSITLCAVPLDLLHWREFVELDFDAVAERDRCELCALLADGE